MLTRLSLNRAIGGLSISARCASTSEVAQDSSLIGREIYAGNTIVRLILKDTKRRNALSLKMIEQLHTELREIDKIQKVRSIILSAEGPAFSAGHDLKELRYSSAEDPLGDECRHSTVFDKHAALLQFMQSMHLPVIAEVGGVAAAAGCQLIASCDVVVASEAATFSVPGQKVGLFCSTPAVPLSRAVPAKVAMDMLLTAEPIDAQAALRAGLVSRVVPAGEERHEAIRVAEAIGKHSRSVTAMGKSFFYAQLGLPLTHAYKVGGRVMVENLKLADAQEGINAFVGKRHPEFGHGSEKAFDEKKLYAQKEALQKQEK
ncbi:hypothetical protein PFISCL1PPCAC_22943 [Pristionchus fissidentatus]|uniref:Enoyl-CoA hydratase domain-containing protein 3, mitochondrial n=1 Tax=Pristionchus fissidentatus TaxID=1538716 RepID=A0AAV5WI70_9BILA|nr:hypothetical protein PFISCL1PPCAC_22943 [Pristionchus fissidentatus]